ncbi:hypothetical protein [Alterisphingorhabdus coralli]|uniref:Uncharacterized protein n=1 Tax=Alterisphingorhabdus coralli TaxID=3071408 RepID=A0AA97FAP4_9SPHN|nr:hypothetical protein [Parasphingorhabdus sp. SCSIO 66989]WOE75610.1 hypothetical protein RB602_02540 [Parasphingorhabdus sp. SCSIO 66989]
MASFLKSDLFRNFAMGFGLGAILLLAAQPSETRADIRSDIASAFSEVHDHLS